MARNVKRVLLSAATGLVCDRYGVEPSHIKSCIYVHAVKQFFLSHPGGFRVDVHVGGCPDDDALFYASSKYFAPSGGGFSMRLADVVEHLGGTVLYSQEALARRL